MRIKIVRITGTDQYGNAVVEDVKVPIYTVAEKYLRALRRFGVRIGLAKSKIKKITSITVQK